MKASHVVAVVALALSIAVGTAAAAAPCGRGVIDDWYDNGTFDRAWDCECVRNALAQVPETRGPYSSPKDDFRRELERQGCEGLGQVAVTIERSSVPGGTDKFVVVSDDALPWEVVIVGGVTVALAALVGMAAYRQRRHRRAGV